ncbi:hypothetical protein C8R44DRAFT_883606 [Mycena epipterygia]|nr:hypothetical protein C8R44DRAFT_883606 [Mycena epipterygia]
MPPHQVNVEPGTPGGTYKPQTLSASPASGGPEVDTMRWTLVDETEHHLLLTSILSNVMITALS